MRSSSMSDVNSTKSKVEVVPFSPLKMDKNK